MHKDEGCLFLCDAALLYWSEEMCCSRLHHPFYLGRCRRQIPEKHGCQTALYYRRFLFTFDVLELTESHIGGILIEEAM